MQQPPEQTSPFVHSLPLVHACNPAGHSLPAQNVTHASPLSPPTLFWSPSWTITWKR
jgi:hypothetical protein